MKISPSTYLAESGISIVDIKILATASLNVCRIGMVSWAIVGALISNPKPITFVLPSTSKLVSTHVTKSPFFLDGTTKEVSCCTKKSEVIHSSLHST